MMRRRPREVVFVSPEAESGLLDSGDRIMRQVIGIDERLRPMTEVEATELLNDPLASLLLRRNIFPATVIEVLEQLDRLNATPEGLPRQDVYVVGEGSQIPLESGEVDRDLRFVITRASSQAPGNQVDLLISTAGAGDPATAFLQIIGWDPTSQAYNFYQREPPATWVWAGSSHHALEPATRGKGPFDSHVNGGLVMKELKQPWNNWHSMSAGVSNALAPSDPRLAALFGQRKGAELFETAVVKPGVGRWNAARVAKAKAADGTIARVRYFLRQLIETTTVNLATSMRESRAIDTEDEVDLPLTFFINADALFNIVGLSPTIAVPLRVPRAVYRDSLRKFEFRLEADSFRQVGDTWFAFLVPEPAFEDLDLVEKMVAAGLLTRRFVASLLMVDFPNPVFSARRSSLLRHVPETVKLVAGGPDLSEQIANAILAAGAQLPDGSPEHEFTANWQLAEDAWAPTFERRIERYFDLVTRQLATAAGFEAYVRLAESRRREVRSLPLAESKLLLPVTNIPSDALSLQMSPEGTVVPR